MKKKLKPKLGTCHEREIEKNPFCKVLIGTHNKHRPTTFYLDITSWTNTKDRDCDISRAIKLLNKRVRQQLYNTLNRDLFDIDKTIVLIHYAETRSNSQYHPFRMDRFFQLEITIYQIDELDLRDEKLLKEVNQIVKMINFIFEHNITFNFHKKKQFKNENAKSNA